MTTLTQPIAKLYKRCARNHHDQCPGSFETWSVCSCPCHAGVSDMRAAPVETCADCPSVKFCTEVEKRCATMPAPAPQMPVTCADKAEAVSEAIAITTPATSFGFKGTHRNNNEQHKGYCAMTGKTNALLRWTEHFHMCASCTSDFAKTFANMDAAAKSTFAAGRMEMCEACKSATKHAMREYALSPTYARVCATAVQNGNYGADHLKPVYLKGGE